MSEKIVIDNPSYGPWLERHSDLLAELSRYKRLEAILRDRADADVDGMNAEMRVLTDWETGETA